MRTGRGVRAVVRKNGLVTSPALLKALQSVSSLQGKFEVVKRVKNTTVKTDESGPGNRINICVREVARFKNEITVNTV